MVTMIPTLKVSFASSKFIFQHQQQVALAVDRAKQITITELNAVMQVTLVFCAEVYSF